ncbi:MAG: hypothetical protein ABJE95_14680 [Byssovorax sp.]
MSERERSSRPPASSRTCAAPKRAPTEIGLDFELDFALDGAAPWPRSYPPPAPAGASPTRSGTLRWGDFARALADRPPASSPVRGGTLKWGELSAAAARAEGLLSSRKSPVRGGTLKWEDLMAQLPPVLAPPALGPIAAAAPPRARDAFESLNLDEALAPLLCAGLVRRSGRNVARRRGFDDRRDPSEPPPKSEIAPPRDLASAIQEALDDDEG